MALPAILAGRSAWGMASRLIGGRTGAALGGGTILGSIGIPSLGIGGNDKPKRRRRRKRLTQSEKNELLWIKEVLGKTAAGVAMHRYL